jgi:antitoxin FitA
MNKHIHIRDFDGASHSKLAERAQKQGISLSEYLRVELAKLAERPTMEELMARLKSLPPVNISSDEIVKIIHEGREERDQQIIDAISFPRVRQN